MASEFSIANFNVTMRKSTSFFNKGFKTKTTDFMTSKWDTSNLIGRVVTITNNIIKILHNKHGNLVNAINTLMCNRAHYISNEYIWIYDLNNDMSLRNTTSVQTLSNLLDNSIIDTQIDQRDEEIIRNLWNVAICYFHWALITPSVYHCSNKITWFRGKSSRYWGCILAQRIPIVKVTHNDAIKYKGPSHKKVSIIPKISEEIINVEQKIYNIIKKENSSFDKTIMQDSFKFSKHINEYLETNGQYYVGSNSSKKLNNLYQKLQKLKTQMLKTSNIATSEVQNKLIMEDGTIVRFRQERQATKSLKETTTIQDTQDTQETEAEESNEVVDCWEDIEI